MAFPTYVAADVANATGRPLDAYPAWTAQALQQAMLLFKISTCLKDWPTDGDDAQLAEYAVLYLADSLVIAQPNAVVTQGPFSSESIGSYSYSLRNAANNVMAGTPLGVSWFDLAVGQLGICESGGINGGVAFGSIGVFENDACFWIDEDGKKHVLSSKDINPVGFPVGSWSGTVRTDP